MEDNPLKKVGQGGIYKCSGWVKFIVFGALLTHPTYNV